MKQLQTNYPSTPLVLLDTGNFSDNPTEIGDLRTASLLQSMKTLGYKAINIGERDLSLGYDDFVARTEGTGMTFLSTNIVKQGTKDPVFSPYAIFDVKGTSGNPVRIGVLGVDRYNPIWQKAGPTGTNLGMASPADMIAPYLPEVRGKSDVVVLLASMSREDARELAKRFPDLNLILGAYGGVYNTVDELEGPVRIVYTGNQGKRIGGEPHHARRQSPCRRRDLLHAFPDRALSDGQDDGRRDRGDRRVDDAAGPSQRNPAARTRRRSSPPATGGH